MAQRFMDDSRSFECRPSSARPTRTARATRPENRAIAAWTVGILRAAAMASQDAAGRAALPLSRARAPGRSLADDDATACRQTYPADGGVEKRQGTKGGSFT